jgi:hypothetical protein
MFIVVVMTVSAIPQSAAQAPKTAVTILEPSLNVSFMYEYGSYVIAYKGDGNDVKYGILDSKTGRVMVPFAYDRLGSQGKGQGLVFTDGLAQARKDGKCGFVNINGEVVIPLEYDDVQWFNNGLAPVKKDGKWGVINTNGDTVIPFEYESISSFYDDTTFANQDGKMGIINKNNEIVIPFEYDWISWTRNPDLAVARKDGKQGIINSNGDVIIPIEYTNVEYAGEGLIAVQTGDFNTGKWGYLNLNNEVVLPIEYDRTGWMFFDGLAFVQKDNFQGFVNTNGEIVIPLEYERTWNSFTNGFARVRKNNKWGIINTKGEVVVSLEYDNIHNEFNEDTGLMGVSKDGKWGFVNTKGEVVIPLEYDSVEQFSHNIVAVQKNEKWGFVDTKGKVVIPIEYDSVSSWYVSDIFSVNIGGKWGFIDINSDVKVPAIYDSTRHAGNEFAVVRSGDWQTGKHGVVCIENGRVIIPLEYDRIEYIDYSDGYFWVQKDGLWGIVAIAALDFTFTPGLILQTSVDSGKTSIGDALEILKYLAGMPNEITKNGRDSRQWKAACITGGSAPVIGDALEILKKLAGLPSLVK